MRKDNNVVDIMSKHGYNAVVDTASTCEGRNNISKGTPEIIVQRREEISELERAADSLELNVIRFREKEMK